MTCVLLVDNGSKRAQATLQLRRLASALTKKAGIEIQPVSLQHADSIDAAELNGEPARVFKPFLEEQLTAGRRKFIVLPLFFGKSRALTSFIPGQIEQLTGVHGSFSLRVADVLYPLPSGEPLLVDILHEHTLTMIDKHGSPVRHVVLTDHGSPIPRVTQVRQDIAAGLQRLFNEDMSVEQAVMERRESKDYDFSGKLLESWLVEKARQGVNKVIVLLLFVLPGRHAGQSGDVEDICRRVMRCYPGFQALITPLVGGHAGLVSILESRLHAVMVERPTA